jgi:hypothetical protein
LPRRYLYVALTSIFALASLLLLVACVLSYWRFDQLIIRTAANNHLGLTSFQGRFVVGWSNAPELRYAFVQPWERRSFRTRDWNAALSGPVAFFPQSVTPYASTIPLPRFNRNPVINTPGTNHRELVLPYWIILLFTIAAATSPWLPWRFSLRTLLIAITLLALLLGTAFATTR